ncbi:MAG TPA: hypothetical protein VGK16_13845 [Candidatus Limnocylindrales bacterium]
MAAESVGLGSTAWASVGLGSTARVSLGLAGLADSDGAALAVVAGAEGPVLPHAATTNPIKGMSVRRRRLLVEKECM